MQQSEDNEKQILEQIADQLGYLRQDHERRVGYLMAAVNFRLRKIRKAERAADARNGGTDER